MLSDADHDYTHLHIEELELAHQILNEIPFACYKLNLDSTMVYANQMAEKLFGIRKENMVGKNVWSVFPEAANTDCFTATNTALNQHQTATYEYVSPVTHTWICLTATPVHNGAIITFKEIDQLKQSKFQLQEERYRLNIAQEVGKMGYFEGSLEDEHIYWSDNLYRIFGLAPQSEPITLDKMMSFVHPDDLDHFRMLMQEHINRQQPFQTINRIIRKDGEVRFVNKRAEFIKSADGAIDRIYGIVQDITDEYHAKKELTESKDLLQSIFDNSPIGMSVLQAVRDEDGNIHDFRIRVVSKELERETGRTDLPGKLYAQEYPGIKASGLYDIMLRVMANGQPDGTEYYYPHEGFNKWFSCMFVKIENGLVASNLDITKRKQAEEEHTKNFTLLRQAEEIALMGSWEYDIPSAKFHWSEGMYNLFNLQQGAAVQPETYLNYATDTSRPQIDHLIECLKTGKSDFEEKLQMDVNGTAKTIKIKGTILKDEDSRPLKFLGVDMDFTATHGAEEKIRKLEAEQQQEVFRVTLATQEEERKRIAESLHNGLGQILYGVKLSLAHVNIKHDKQNADVLQQADRLLTDAIKESRRLSHELVPVVLQDFGLKAAIEDICRQLSGEVNFKCEYIGIPRIQDKYVETALYRMAQEIMMNIVKHAKATEAIVKIEISKKVIMLYIEDNGQGFDIHSVNSKGIGLNTIRSKINLLNGKLQIKSAAGQGTQVYIKIYRPKAE